jgi:hypothetical protein
MAAFADLLDHFGAEGRQIVGLARCDEAVIDDDLLIHPIGAGIGEIGLEPLRYGF